jgi:methanogenic corrinoid protein MtbC1
VSQRIRLQKPDGTFVELDAETSAQVRAIAAKKGISPMDVIRDAFKHGYDAMFEVN